MMSSRRPRGATRSALAIAALLGLVAGVNCQTPSPTTPPGDSGVDPAAGGDEGPSAEAGDEAADANAGGGADAGADGAGAADDGAPVDQTATDRPDGASCLAASECASGICEGEGCGDDQPGTCQPTSRMCTRDLRQYCGCDGETFGASGSCPGKRFSARAPCGG